MISFWLRHVPGAPRFAGRDRRSDPWQRERCQQVPERGFGGELAVVEFVGLQPDTGQRPERAAVEDEVHRGASRRPVQGKRQLPVD